MPIDIPAERLRSLLEVIRQANAETEPTAVIALTCRQAAALLDAEGAGLYLLDKTTGELAPAVSVGSPGRRSRLKLHQGIAGLVAATAQPIVVEDAHADARFDGTADEETGQRTRDVACAPLTNRRGDVLGAVEVLNRRTGRFTDEDGELLRLLAGQAGIALANVQIYDGLRTNLDRLSRLMKVGAAISSELDLDALLRTISQTTSHLLQAERSTVFIVDRAREELWSRVAEGLEQAEIRIPLASGIAGAVASTGSSVRIDDAYTDSRFNPDVDRRTGYQTRTVLCVPMRNRRGEVIGVFQVLNKRDGSFTPLDEQLLGALSSQAAVAVENARLHEEVQRAYGELQALDRMKSGFLNAISHELRTPLAAILGYSEILLGGPPDSLAPEPRQAVAAIAESGQRLLALIESLLAFVRLDQGDMVLRPEPVHLAPLTARALEAFQGRAEERKLSLLDDVPAELPPVVADPQELHMAMTQLLDNATKFTQPGGHVEVRARPITEDGGGCVEVAVSDDGIGIPPALHARIFERFFQVDASLGRHFGGVGIGLAIVKQILAAHGTAVSVESEAGKGATFRFRLPVAGREVA
jgi:signal transduction histidine kinase